MKNCKGWRSVVALVLWCPEEKLIEVRHLFVCVWESARVTGAEYWDGRGEGRTMYVWEREEGRTVYGRVEVKTCRIGR